MLLRAHVKQKVVIVDFEHSRLSIRVIFYREEAQRAQLHASVDVATVVVNHLATALPLTQELLGLRLRRIIELIWLLFRWFISHIF